MNIIFLVLLFCFLVFLYILYYLSKDDFIIVRKDISLEKIFNLAFLGGFSSLIFSRIFYVLFNPSPQFFNPLVFLAFPYFPGLSLIGGVIGGFLFIYFYSGYKKMPVGKMLDLFAMSFISVLPIGFLITFLLLMGKTSLFYNLLFIFTFIMFLFFAKIINPFSLRGEIKDGSLGLIFISLFSLIYFIIKLFLSIKTFSFLDLENIILLISLFSSLVMLVNQEIMNKFLIKK